MIGTTKTTKHK